MEVLTIDRSAWHGLEDVQELVRGAKDDPDVDRVFVVVVGRRASRGVTVMQHGNAYRVAGTSSFLELLGAMQVAQHDLAGREGTDAPCG